MDLVTSWVLVVRKWEELGITAGGLFCGPGLGVIQFPESAKTQSCCRKLDGYFHCKSWDPAGADGQVGRHVSQEKFLDRLH